MNNYQEIIKALLDGQKLCHPNFDEGDFIYINKDGALVRNFPGPFTCSFSYPLEWKIYCLPKQKVKYYQWAFQGSNGDWLLSSILAKSIEEFSKKCVSSSNCAIVLTDFFIEVEE